MTGNVRDRHILLPLTFRLSGLPDVTVDFVVDTGFTGLLTLPLEAVRAMRLPFLHRIPAKLADGSYIEVENYSATVTWNGGETEVRVLATGDRPLLGTALLYGSELMAQFREEGLVTIDEL
jgi:clan AA aspartic protease